MTAPRYQVLVWVPLLFLPVVVNQQTAATDQPIAWLLKTMLVSVGLPFVVLASTAPLLQRWYSSLPHRSAADPYWLYSASNVGSLAGTASCRGDIGPVAAPKKWFKGPV